MTGRKGRVPSCGRAPVHELAKRSRSTEHSLANTHTQRRVPPVTRGSTMAAGDLSKHTIGCGAFDSLEWFAAWREAFLTVGDWRVPGDGLPLIRDVARYGPFRVARLRGPYNEHVPWLSLPRSPVSRAAGRWLSVFRADVLFLPSVRQAPELVPLARLMHCEPIEEAPYTDCTGAWDAYWRGRGSKSRAEWGRSERRLREQGFGLVCQRGEAQLDAALDDAFAIEADGWKGDQGSAIRQDPKLERFYHRVAHDWARRGLLRLYFLEDGERRIAFQLCALDGRQLVSLKIGFRRAFAREGPGQALQLMILRELFADPDVDRFDMLGPATEHKMKWATDVEQLWTVRCYRPGLRGGVAALRWSVLPAMRARFRRAVRGGFRVWG